ncbi:hypothetical protein SEPCBS119000_005343 [Sporothrix epigloea]|uniref:Uncharacterized protein n=1 Tax=Sporothrix epigloea TaxID=1892477 RepID=A0ABP0DXD7_9PEZI
MFAQPHQQSIEGASGPSGPGVYIAHQQSNKYEALTSGSSNDADAQQPRQQPQQYLSTPAPIERQSSFIGLPPVRRTSTLRINVPSLMGDDDARSTSNDAQYRPSLVDESQQQGGISTATEQSQLHQQSTSNGPKYRAQSSQPSFSPDTALRQRTASWVLQLQEQEKQLLPQALSVSQKPSQSSSVPAHPSLPLQQQRLATQEQHPGRYQKQSHILPQQQQHMSPTSGWNLQESHLQEPLASTRHHSSPQGLHSQELQQARLQQQQQQLQQIPIQLKNAVPSQLMQPGPPQGQPNLLKECFTAGAAMVDGNDQKTRQAPGWRLSSPDFSSHLAKSASQQKQEEAPLVGGTHDPPHVHLRQQRLSQPQIQQQPQEQPQRQRQQQHQSSLYQPYRPIQYQHTLRQQDHLPQKQQGAASTRQDTQRPPLTPNDSFGRTNTSVNIVSSEGSPNRRASGLLSGFMGKMLGKDKEKPNNEAAAAALTHNSGPRHLPGATSSADNRPSSIFGWPQHSQTGHNQPHGLPSGQQRFQQKMSLGNPTVPTKDVPASHSAWARAASNSISSPQQRQQNSLPSHLASLQSPSSQPAPLPANLAINTRPLQPSDRPLHFQSPRQDGPQGDGLADSGYASLTPGTVSPADMANQSGSPLMRETSAHQTVSPQSGSVSDASTGVAMSTPVTVSPLDRLSVDTASPGYVGLSSASRGRLYPAPSPPVSGKVTRKPVPSRALPLHQSSKPAPSVQSATEPPANQTYAAAGTSIQHHVITPLQQPPGVARTRERPSSTVSSLTVYGAADSGAKPSTEVFSASNDHSHKSSPAVSSVSEQYTAGSSGAIISPLPPPQRQHQRESTAEQPRFSGSPYPEQQSRPPLNNVKAGKLSDQQQGWTESDNRDLGAQDHSSRTGKETARAKKFFARILKRGSTSGDLAPAASTGAADPKGPPPGGPRYPLGDAAPSPHQRYSIHDEDVHGRRLSGPMQPSTLSDRPPQDGGSFATTDARTQALQRQIVPIDSRPRRQDQPYRRPQYSADFDLQGRTAVQEEGSINHFKQHNRGAQQQPNQSHRVQQVRQQEAANGQLQQSSPQNYGTTIGQAHIQLGAAVQANAIVPLHSTQQPLPHAHALSPNTSVSFAAPLNSTPQPTLPILQQQQKIETCKGEPVPSVNPGTPVSSVHTSPQPGLAQLGRDSAKAHDTDASHQRSHGAVATSSEPVSQLTTVLTEPATTIADVIPTPPTADTSIESQRPYQGTLILDTQPILTGAPAPAPAVAEWIDPATSDTAAKEDISRVDGARHEAASSHSEKAPGILTADKDSSVLPAQLTPEVASVNVVPQTDKPLVMKAPGSNASKENAVIAMPKVQNVDEKPGAPSPIAQLGSMEPGIHDITPPSPVDDMDLTGYGFPGAGTLSATGGLPLPYMSHGGPNGDSQTDGNTVDGAHAVTRQKTIRQTPAQEYEEYKRRQMLKDLEEKIPVVIPEPDHNLVAQEHKENEEPAMSATSYPGQEWHPYGEFDYEDDE